MRQSFSAMGSTVDILVNDTGMQVGAVVDTARSAIHRYERLLSRFLADSDVSRINAHAGRWVPVHPATLEVLQLAYAAFVASGGLFNPCLGDQLERLGYDRSFDDIEPRLVDGQPTVFVRAALPVQWSADGGLVRIEEGYKLDFGGIAKGWIVEQAAGILEDAGFTSFICSAGGDLVCRGGPWPIGIDDPFRAGACVAICEVDSMAVATSGTYRRAWQGGGRTVHHLLDPRTGLSSDTDIVLCTVLHTSLVKAEVLAKVAILLGADVAPSYLERGGAAGWFIVLHDGTSMKCSNMGFDRLLCSECHEERPGEAACAF